ncbi:hypothetical protein YC2023_024945 [Brassica napus]
MTYRIIGYWVDHGHTADPGQISKHWSDVKIVVEVQGQLVSTTINCTFPEILRRIAANWMVVGHQQLLTLQGYTIFKITVHGNRDGLLYSFSAITRDCHREKSLPRVFTTSIALLLINPNTTVTDPSLKCLFNPSTMIRSSMRISLL